MRVNAYIRAHTNAYIRAHVNAYISAHVDFNCFISSATPTATISKPEQLAYYCHLCMSVLCRTHIHCRCHMCQTFNCVTLAFFVYVYI